MLVNCPMLAVGIKKYYCLAVVLVNAAENGLDPYPHLRKIFTELPQATSVEESEALLPWSVKGAVD